MLKSKKLLFRLSAIILILLIIVGGLVYNQILNNSKGNNNDEPKITTIDFWSTTLDSTITNSLIEDFQKENPTIKVNYQRQSNTEYKDRVETRLNTGNAAQLPDVLEIPEAWISEFGPTKLSIITKSFGNDTFSVRQLENNSINNLLYGVPFKYDGLTVVYNESHLGSLDLNSSDLDGMNWTLAFQTARDLTEVTNVEVSPGRSKVSIKKSGMAIGSPSNVTLSSKILSLIAIQNEVNFYDPILNQYDIDKNFSDSLNFYLSFNEANIWNDEIKNDIQAFIDGDVSMIITDSKGLAQIKSEAKFPYDSTFPFKVNERIGISLGNSLVIPSLRTGNQEASEKFIEYLSSPEVQKRIYDENKETYIPTNIESLRLLESSDPNNIFLDLAPISKRIIVGDFDIFQDIINSELKLLYEEAYSSDTGEYIFRNIGSFVVERIESQLNEAIKEEQLDI